MKTLNHDDEDGPVQELVDAMTQHLHDEAAQEDTKPPGYGTLGKTYEWRSYETPGARAYVRSWCLTDDRWMTLTLKVDPRYGKHTSRFADKVDFNGKPVQCWECRDCGQWVVK